MLDRIRTWFRLRGTSVQYERQRMTFKGGWKREEPFYVEGRYDPPETDDDYIITRPGRYREIRRVDGRIDQVPWVYETADAQEYYERRREAERAEQEKEDPPPGRPIESVTRERDEPADISDEDRREVERLQTILAELERRLEDRRAR